jgi:hypothetical protein
MHGYARRPLRYVGILVRDPQGPPETNSATSNTEGSAVSLRYRLPNTAKRIRLGPRNPLHKLPRSNATQSYISTPFSCSKKQTPNRLIPNIAINIEIKYNKTTVDVTTAGSMNFRNVVFNQIQSRSCTVLLHTGITQDFSFRNCHVSLYLDGFQITL